MLDKCLNRIAKQIARCSIQRNRCAACRTRDYVARECSPPERTPSGIKRAIMVELISGAWKWSCASSWPSCHIDVQGFMVLACWHVAHKLRPLRRRDISMLDADVLRTCRIPSWHPAQSRKAPVMLFSR
jgi:hypothetical protein